MDHPHLVVIMADQLRPDFVGRSFTPHINRLMAESTVFNRSYCSSPLCVPARGSFFTGTYPNENGCLINPWAEQDHVHGLVRSNLANLYEHLEHTWDSWHTGKQHFLTEDQIDRADDAKTHWLSLEDHYPPFLESIDQRPPGGEDFRAALPELVSGQVTHRPAYSIPSIGRYDGGFDDFFDGFILNQSLDAIQNRDRTKPFLLNAMFLAPHPPLEIPEPYYSKIKEIDLPENVGRWSSDQSPLQMYNLTGFFGERYSRDDWAKIWPIYAGLVSLLDDCVGRIISTLKEEGIYDDAIIVFLADHGEMLGSHRLWQKMCMYEESIRTPLAIKLPKGEAHVESVDDLVSHVDIFPTLCDLVGVEIPDPVSGRSLAGCIREGRTAERDHVFVQFDGNGALGNFQRCVVQGNFKLIVDTFKDEVFFELYDVIADPQEQKNLAFDASDKMKPLYRLLLNHMASTNDHLALKEADYDQFLKAYAPLRI